MTPGRWINGRLKRAAVHHRTLLTFCFVCLLCVCGLTAHMLQEMRRQAWTGAMEGAENLLAALSQDISRNIEFYDLSLEAVLDGLKLPDIDKLRPEVLQAVLFDRAATARFLGSNLILDETGRVVGDSVSVPPRNENFSDREYFQVHKADPHVGLFISAPFRRRLAGAGDLAIAFSRRIDHPDGSFGGVVLSTLRLDYFKELFQRFRLGAHGSVSLFRTDGSMLMRVPYDETMIGQTLAAGGLGGQSQHPSGRIDHVATLDGMEHVVNYAHVDKLPLILNVNLSAQDIFAHWNGQAAVIAGVLAAVSVAMGGLGILFSSELRRRFRSEVEMRESEAQLRLLADHATDVIIRLDATLTRRYVSSSCRTILGYEPHEMIGQHPGVLMHPDDWPRVSRVIEDARQCEGHIALDYRVRRRDGCYVWVEGRYGYMACDGGFTVVLRDVTQRKSTEQELAAVHAELTRMSMTDGLTGLANRRRFDEAIGQEWRRAAREELPLTLLMLDVDRFKQFNDRYGHQQGDACLIAIAQAVGGCARRPADLVARYGGEEIAVLLPGTDEATAAVIAERVRQTIAALGIPHAGNEAHGSVVTTSIGFSTVVPCTRMPADDDIRTLIAAADRALYAAKAGGRNCTAVDRNIACRVAEAFAVQG